MNEYWNINEILLLKKFLKKKQGSQTIDLYELSKLTGKKINVISSKLSEIKHTIKKDDLEMANYIISIILTKYHLSKEEMLSKSRLTYIIKTRQFIAYFLSKYTSYSQSEIGFFLKKDRITISKGIETRQCLIDTDRIIFIEYTELDKIFSEKNLKILSKFTDNKKSIDNIDNKKIEFKKSLNDVNLKIMFNEIISYYNGRLRGLS